MKKQKRITPIDFGGVALKIDADRSWQSFLEMPATERVSMASTSFHFLIHLGWMDLPYPLKARFLAAFDSEEACRARSVAIGGLTAHNHQAEFNLVQSAMDFHRSRCTGGFKSDPETCKAHALSLAVEFSEMVAKLDPAAFRRIATIIENGGQPQGDRGGVGSEDGFMLEKFCELHALTRSLPTKKQLRESCGLNDLESKKVADKRMRKLGLSGLPTEPEI